MESKLLTVVFTDIKGFTEKTSSGDREFVLKLRKKHDSILKPVIEKYGGKLVKTIGDAFLLTFESPTNAVLCSLMMQAKLRDFNDNVSAEEKIEIRIAINTGEVTLDEGDVLGEPVNVAARLEGITQPNEIWFAESTYLAMNKKEVPNSLVGDFRLKGIPESLKVYRVVQDLDSEEFKRVLNSQNIMLEQAGLAKKSLLHPVVVFVAILVVLAGSIFLYSEYSYSQSLKMVEKAISSGNHIEVFEQIDLLLKQRPESEKVVKLAIKNFDQVVRSYIRKKELEKAREVFDQYSFKYGFLNDQVKLESDLLLAEAFASQEHGSSQKRSMALNKIEAEFSRLIEKYPDSHYPLKIAVKFYTKTGRNIYATMRYSFKLAKLDPASYSADQMILKNWEYFLKNFESSHYFDKYDELLRFIGKHSFKNFETFLTEAIDSNDPEDLKLKWNAKKIMQNRGIQVDVSRVYLSEILHNSEKPDSERLDKAINFFLSEAEQSDVPEKIENIGLFKTSLNKEHKIFELLADRFKEPAQDFLEKSLTQRESMNRRFNAFTAFEHMGFPKGAKDAFYLANFIDWDFFARFGSYREIFSQSLDFVSTRGITDEAVKYFDVDTEILVKMCKKRAVDLEKQLKKYLKLAKLDDDQALADYWQNMLNKVRQFKEHL